MKKYNFAFLFCFSLKIVLSQSPAGNNQEIQFNNNGVFGASPYLTWDGTNLKFLDLGAYSARLYFKSENGDDSYIFSENYGPNKNRLVFHTRDDGDQDYAVFRNRHWNDGEKDVFEIHRTWTKANSNFYVVNGNVGIGTTAPNSQLNVGTKTTNSPSAVAQFGVSKASAEARVLSLVNSGGGSNQSTSIDFHNGPSWSPTGKIQVQQLGTDTKSKIHFYTYNSGLKNRMTINENGNVGIGTIIPDEKLAVNGNIHTKEVRVDLIGWSDFVFDEDYNLPTLKEVEKHIKENGHLKDIPSAEEVAKRGILLGDMNAKLLQKIEELTLYTIAQEKKLKLLLEKIEKLENKE